MTADDERAALALVATGHAIAITADPTLQAPGVARCEVDTNPVPLRLRAVHSRTHRTPATAPPVLAAITQVLTTAAAGTGSTR